MEDTRKFLISKGMTPHFAGILAARYIRGLEDKSTHKVVSLVDLFSNHKKGAMQALSQTQMSGVAVNYTTLDKLSHDVNAKAQLHYLNSLSKNSFGATLRSLNMGGLGARSSQIVRPMARAFSSPQRGKFFDFLKAIERTEEKQKKQEEQEKAEVDDAINEEIGKKHAQ